jgi:signal transduction histidine kinase
MKRRGFLVDVLVAAVAFVISAAVLHSADRSAPDTRDPDVLAYGLLAAYSLSVPLRGRYPRVAVAVGLLSGFAYAVASYPPALTPVALLPIYTAATRLEWKESRRLLVSAMLVTAAGTTAGPGATDLGAPVLVAGVWLLGHYVRARRVYTEQLEHKNQELERAQHDLARQAVTEERLRIARELHDVVAHTISVVAVHAGSGRLVAVDDPAGAQRALETIETASRSALGEMRRLLGLLRTSDGDPPDALEPAPGMRDIDQLAAHVVASGVAVDMRIEGERSVIPAGVDLCAYRVVQEALTNVMKHANATRVTVAVRYSATEIAVEVDDDGRGLSGDPATRSNEGHGLIGMRERVALDGGELDIGPRAGGGFHVAARFPLGSDA